MRACQGPAGSGCPTGALVPAGTRGSRCPTCRSTTDRARGTTTQRGYGATHQATRADYQRRMNENEQFNCWRCDEPIDPQAWTLGHCDIDRSRYHGPECPTCNYPTAGRTGCPHHSHT